MREQQKIHRLEKAKQQLQQVDNYLSKYYEISRRNGVKYFNKKQNIGHRNRKVHEKLEHQVLESLLVNVEIKLVQAKPVMNKEIKNLVD